MIADSEGIMSIRPEDVRLSGEGESNALTGQIQSHVYVGNHSRLRVAVEGCEVNVVAEADILKRYKQGDEINLRFPEEKLWVLPPESAAP